MRFPFGPWEPDSAGVDIKDGEGRVVMADAKNVWPSKTGYIPVPQLSEYSSYALPSKCVGAFAARDTDGSVIIFAGTTTDLYKYDPGSGWVEYTRTVGGDYSVPTDEYWSFTQFGTHVIAVNFNDAPQTIDISTGATNFSALGGSPPTARYVGVVGDFVILASQSTNDRKITNSAINDQTGWSVGTGLCDEQEMPDGGAITGFAGGEFGWVLQTNAIRRMMFQPGFDQAFRFERVEQEHGAGAGFSLISIGRAIFFLADDGFYSFTDTLVPIGAQRVNEWFRSNSDSTRFFSVLAFSDPYTPRVNWAFYNSETDTDFTHVITYDWHIDRWSYQLADAQFWVRAETAALTLEGLDTPYPDLDVDVPFSLDSRVWAGGQPVTAAITPDGTLAFLNGATPMDATLLTSSMHLTPGARTNVSDIYPLGIFNDATIALRVGKREHTKNAVSYTGSLTPSTRSGIARCRATGRVHEVELTLSQSSGTLWTHAEGLDLTIAPDGLQ